MNIDIHEHRNILYLPLCLVHLIATFGYKVLNPAVLTKNNGVPSVLVQSVPRGPQSHWTPHPPAPQRPRHVPLPPPYGCMHYFWGKHGNAICIQAFICSPPYPLWPLPCTVVAITFRCPLCASLQLRSWCRVVLSFCVFQGEVVWEDARVGGRGNGC